MTDAVANEFTLPLPPNVALWLRLRNSRARSEEIRFSRLSLGSVEHWLNGGDWFDMRRGS